MEKIDPATNPVIRQFLDLFVPDPVLRLAVEEYLSHEASVNPDNSGNGLEALDLFNQVYLTAKHDDARKLIAYGANAGVLGMLEEWRRRKEAQ